MRDVMLAPFCRVDFNAQELMTSHPPRWRDPNKQVVAEISCPTVYNDEASSIKFRRSVRSGLGCLGVAAQYRLCKWGLARSVRFTAIDGKAVRR